MAKKYEDFFRSEADGLEISVLCICPEEKPYRAIVQLVHGMCEHKERYIPFMEYLAEQGFVTVIHDHRGHEGVSVPKMISDICTVAEQRECSRTLRK